ncbi:heterokaryon incompatibility protein-domain-containing protein, partial [Leptodontidium sp. MPI-SDFR-AT-0119]
MALSYVWGDPAAPHPILLDGRIVFVTSNLNTALEHLQHGQTGLPIWVDALCINQADNVEKSWQVQQMLLVYQRAALVIVWLGPASDSSDLAIEMLNKIGKEALDYELGNAVSPGRTRDRIMTLLGYGRDNEAHIKHVMRSISALLARPWWQRVWVIQELAANFNAVFGCGYDKIQSFHLLLAINWFSRCASELLVADQQVAPENTVLLRGGSENPTMIFHIAITKGIGKLTLFDLLHKTQVLPIQFNATDPRDIIFALLGISSDQDELGIVPDYSKSYRNVFVRTAISLLEKGHISMLCLSQTLGFDGLPSWVPDWSTKIQCPFEGLLRRFSACGRHLSNISFDNSQQRLLSLSGTPVGPVHSVGARRPRIDTFLDSEESVIEGLEAMSRWHLDCITELTSMSQNLGHVIYGAQEGLEDAICRTLVADVERQNISSLRNAGESSRQAYRILKTGPVDYVRRRCDLPLLQKVESYYAHLTDTLGGRRVFILQNGHIGLGPSESHPGDLVVVIHGMSVPFVLRKGDNGNFILVGEAYVHGIMYGEWVNDNP